MNLLISIWLKKYLNQYYPDEKYSDFKDYWIDHAYEFPRIADVETTNICDAHCLCCNAYKMTKEKGLMTYDKFVEVANILKTHNCKLRGMYTTGNPLLDPTIFEKFAYARKIGIMASHSDLNTTTSLLVSALYKKILDNTDNITLSFFSIGQEFERLTGGLNWKECYSNAINFIKFRDTYRPGYRIFIGCNNVNGNNLLSVKKAFKGYNVEWARDAELRWSGPVITGVIDRVIMYPHFRCDGHFGALKIKWNGNIEACAYDFNEETLFANIFNDDWETICQKFLINWAKPFHLCQRCDYYNKYWMVKKNHFRDVNYNEWQLPFLKTGEAFQK
jgi:hypothetical protein